MKIAIAFMAFAFVPSALPAFDPHRQTSIIQQPESTFDATRRAMKRLKPGMDSDEVERLLPVKNRKIAWVTGSASGFTERFEIGKDCLLVLSYVNTRQLRRELSGASLYRGHQLLVRVGE